MSVLPPAWLAPPTQVSVEVEGRLRHRSVGRQVVTDGLRIPAPPARLLTDWQRETQQQLALEVGDVECLPLARARMRWPDYRLCVQALQAWAQPLGLQALLEHSEQALMACRGARYHHDGLQYGGMAFCNLFLSEDQGLDVHFPAIGRRIPLQRGTVLLFDTFQPHAVVARERDAFEPADFSDPARTQVFLTWELSLQDPLLPRLLGVDWHS